MMLTVKLSNSRDVTLAAVLVDGAFRGRGLGRVLMQHAEAYARSYVLSDYDSGWVFYP
jgi:GNAT superfamily N-acetyltransferase